MQVVLFAMSDYKVTVHTCLFHFSYIVVDRWMCDVTNRNLAKSHLF